MADLGVAKVDILVRMHGADEVPYQVATVEIPLRGVRVVDGKARPFPDFSEFERLGRVLAETLEEEWHG